MFEKLRVCLGTVLTVDMKVKIGLRNGTGR